MASTLPHHILTYIGTLVDKKYRLDCALVCKHWTEPFLNAYWGRLYIGNYKIKINTAISNKSILINAHRVWAMEFHGFHLDNYERILEFQRSFPGIRYLESLDFGLHVFPISAALDWSLWQSLTHISISLSHESKAESFRSLFMKLSVLPCLIHLNLHESHDFSKRPLHSWKSFEYIHYQLPRLEYLDHNLSFKPITRDEIESIKAVKPAQTMTKMKFCNQVGTLWFFYFALKYPNLQHFSRGYVSPENRNQVYYDHQQYQSDLQLLSTLDQFFPCLKQPYVFLEDNNKYPLFIFFETLGHFGTKIEHVNLYYYSCMKDDDINRCIQPISESLKVLHIILHAREAIRFDVYARLVTLRIRGTGSIRITADEILESFPALRSLSVDDIEFSLSTNPHTYTPHPLQRLTIQKSKITNDALRYVSLRCNQLKHVKFIDILYNGIHDYFYKDEAGQLIFDMPMSNLDTFIFTFMDQLLHEYEGFPRHYIIEQMENDNEIVQATQQSSRINWYHVCCDRTNRKEKVLKWELGRRDIEFCQRYFKDYDRRKKREKGRKDIKKDEFGYVQRRFWKKDLKHGVLVFRFKSVKNHYFRIKSYPY